MLKNRVAWTLPSFEDELGEFNRYDLSREEVAAIRDQFSQSNMVKLTEDIWSRLNNTDSYDVRDEDEVASLAQEYMKDWVSIKERLEDGGPMDAPIVLLRDGDYELVAGNTRLMLCRTMGITPQVLLVEL
jgi:hypothetical protein